MKTVELAPDAWLIYTDTPLDLAAAIPRHGLDEVVPAADCVLVQGRAAAAIAANPPAPRPAADLSEITLPAQFDGEDLPAIAAAADCSVDDLIRTMLTTTFTVAFCGFSPGFAYLTGLPVQLHLPRRERPRARVPAGSIAIASGYAAVYPTDSPAGWHLLGRSAAVLFDPNARPPALLAPGTRVRFA